MKVIRVISDNCVVQNRKNLMQYACEKKAGYMKDLIAQDSFNGKTVEEFKSMGFINTGYTAEAKTWSATELLKNFAKEMDLI